MLSPKLTEILHLKGNLYLRAIKIIISWFCFHQNYCFRAKLFCSFHFWVSNKWWFQFGPLLDPCFVGVLSRSMCQISWRSRIQLPPLKRILRQTTSHATAKVRVWRKAAKILNKVCCKAARWAGSNGKAQWGCLSQGTESRTFLSPNYDFYWIPAFLGPEVQASPFAPFWINPLKSPGTCFSYFWRLRVLSLLIRATHFDYVGFGHRHSLT